MDKRWLHISLVSTLILIVALLAAVGCGKKKVKFRTVCEEVILYYDNEGRPVYGVECKVVATWGVEDPQDMLEVVQSVDYPDCKFIVSVPEDTDLEIVDGGAKVEYLSESQTKSKSESMAYNSFRSTDLTASKNDARDWHVMEMSGTEADFDAWVATLEDGDVLSSHDFSFAATWKPATAGCGAFSLYEVDLYAQFNALDGTFYLDTTTMSYGKTLSAGLLGPINEAPSSSFVGSPEDARAILEAIVQKAVDKAENDDHDGAIEGLEIHFTERIDGIIGGDPTDDLITDPDLQQLLIDASDGFVSELEYAQSACS